MQSRRLIPNTALYWVCRVCRIYFCFLNILQLDSCLNEILFTLILLSLFKLVLTSPNVINNDLCKIHMKVISVEKMVNKAFFWYCSLAKSQQYDQDGLIDIFTQYGDHLYKKGDHDGAIDQYIKTIGKLEASYVIRKVSCYTGIQLDRFISQWRARNNVERTLCPTLFDFLFIVQVYVYTPVKRMANKIIMFKLNRFTFMCS